MSVMFAQALPGEQSAPALELWKTFGPIIAAVLTVLGVALTCYITLRKSRKDALFTYAAKALDLRVRQLNEFYAPLRLHLEQSRILYKKLQWSLEKLGKQNAAAKIDLNGFRLLDHAYALLNEAQYEDVKPIVSSILDLGDKISELISKNAGLVEGGLTPTFIEYRAHLELLKSAAKQKPFGTASEGWQEFQYYPRLLNREVMEGYKEVLRHFEVFQQASDRTVWKLLGKTPDSRRESLQQLLDNINYYERSFQSYVEKFDSFDMFAQRDALKRALIPNAAKSTEPVSTPKTRKLLEAGCGTGRDAAAFISDGFEVTAFDISPAMVRLCNRRIRALKESGSEIERSAADQSRCEELAFDEIRYRNEFDAVWASASLLHLPKHEIRPTIERLVRALRLNGVLFMSFKHGRGEAIFDSRHYSYYRRSELSEIVRRIPNAQLHEIWLSDSKGKKLSWCRAALASWKLEFTGKPQMWVNVLIRKIP